MLLTVAVIFLAGCSQPADNALRFGLSSAPINLDPRFATDATSTRINRLLYQRLVDFDDAYRATPSLATWQQLSPRHYRFTLQADKLGRFASGDFLSATDVKATYESVLDESVASPHRAGFTMVDRIEVYDENTVDFFLNKSDALFPGRLVVGILPQSVLGDNQSHSRAPNGSGTFEFVQWPEDGLLQLKRRHDGQLLSFIEVKNPTVRVLKLLRGELDMVQNNLPTELVTYLVDQKQDEVTVSKGRGSNYTYLGFNLADEDMGKLKLREAIAYAIDREAIIHYVMGDGAALANALLPPDHWAGNPDVGQYRHDAERARKLLKEAGYGENNPAHIVYKTSSDPFRIRLATVIQQQLAEVGIVVDLRSYDWGTFYGDIKAGRFQMYSLSWVGIKTPDIYRYVFHSEAIPPNGANRGRYEDAKVDALIDAAEATDDLTQQAVKYRQLQQRLWQQLPYVPLWYEDHVFISRSNVSGYRLARDGNYDGLMTVQRSDSE